MKIYRARLCKEALLKIPPEESQLFLALAHLQNEISYLQRSVLWTSDFSSDNEAEVHGQLCLSFFFTKLLAGKLNEGWQLLQSHFSNNRTLSEGFHDRGSEIGVEALKDLRKYFGKSNIIHNVRNNYTFHYSPEDFINAAKDVPDDLDMYIEKGTNANSLYYFAEVLANRAMINSIDPEDIVSANQKFNAEVTKVAQLFSRFGQAFLQDIIKQHAPEIWEDRAVKVEFEDLPDFSTTQIKWFSDTSNGLQAEKHNADAMRRPKGHS